MQRNTVGILSIAVVAVLLLGAGCRAKPPALPVGSGAGAPSANGAPASDPLADDLDAAIEDLNAME
ncbi:hypothetical protein HY634_00075 [Candidatus Uhrbacteria bacterium]|nr:hypothetical protein [Candidatus Uhrbacteria bacterium]